MKTIVNDFYSIYSAEPIVVRSPGRINIIGEHTDYNEGFVLPAAIDKFAYAAVSKNDNREIKLYSTTYNEHFSTSVHSVHPQQIGWANYVLGVVDQLQKNGYPIDGFNMKLDGDVPLGAGLSSSAAVECATIFALNELFTLGIDKMSLVKMAQKAEHVFAGVNCGIMDQFASVFGSKNNAVRLDCKTLEYDYIPIDLSGYSILLFNTNVQHNLASSEYNLRRSQCEEGVSIVKKYLPQVNSLRDVSLAHLNQYVQPVEDIIYRRCKHVVTENIRLHDSCQNLKTGNIRALGKKMFESHDSLSKDFEVSCKELDFLAHGIRGEYGVLGARMMGGGFGGCTINIVMEEVSDKIEEEAKRKYSAAFGKKLSVYKVNIENGTEIMHQLCLI